jgi:hypothetical protein
MNTAHLKQDKTRIIVKPRGAANNCKAEGGSRLQLPALAENNPAVAPIAPVAALLPHPTPLDHVGRRTISKTSQKVNHI